MNCREKVHELKETQKGVELMCHEMEKIYSEGMESGELKKAKETALYGRRGDGC